MLAKVSRGVWVTLTPDGEHEIIDLNVVVHVVSDRGAPFPDLPGGAAPETIYAFDPISRTELAAHKRRAKLSAAIRGDEAIVEPAAPCWKYS